MKFFRWGRDGGVQSSVFGFWFVEIKCLFSIVLLRFEGDSREAFHSHAFNALTWWLTGEVEEILVDGTTRRWRPSLLPKVTRRSCFHKVKPLRRTWALSIRGPWSKTWHEYNRSTQELTTFAHSRRVVDRRWHA